MLGGGNDQRPTIPKSSKSLLVKARITSTQHTILTEHKLDLMTNCYADGMPRVECLLNYEKGLY